MNLSLQDFILKKMLQGVKCLVAFFVWEVLLTIYQKFIKNKENLKLFFAICV